MWTNDKHITAYLVRIIHMWREFMLCCSLFVYIYSGMHSCNNPEARRRNYVSASDIYYRQHLNIRMRRLQIALWAWTRLFMDTPPKHSKSITWRTNRLLSLTDKILSSSGSRPRPTRSSQIHSARRQATLRSGHFQRIEDINATNTAGPIILGLPSTILQETGPAASAPNTRTHALDYVCVCPVHLRLCAMHFQ